MSNNTWTVSIPQPPLEVERKLVVQEGNVACEPTHYDWERIHALACKALSPPAEPAKEEPVGYVSGDYVAGISGLCSGRIHRQPHARWCRPVYLSPPLSAPVVTEPVESWIQEKINAAKAEVLKHRTWGDLCESMAVQIPASTYVLEDRCRKLNAGWDECLAQRDAATARAEKAEARASSAETQLASCDRVLIHAERQRDALVDEIATVANWSDRSYLHAIDHVKPMLLNLGASINTERKLREQAESAAAAAHAAGVEAQRELQSVIGYCANELEQDLTSWDLTDATKAVDRTVTDLREKLAACEMDCASKRKSRDEAQRRVEELSAECILKEEYGEQEHFRADRLERRVKELTDQLAARPVAYPPEVQAVVDAASGWAESFSFEHHNNPRVHALLTAVCSLPSAGVRCVTGWAAPTSMDTKLCDGPVVYWSRNSGATREVTICWIDAPAKGSDK